MRAPCWLKPWDWPLCASQICRRTTLRRLREPVWLAGKAAFYVSLHDFARGQEYSHRLLAAYGQQPNVHCLQGTLLKFQMEPAEAAKEFRKELEISPQHVPAMLELAQFDIDNSNLNEAMSLARHAAQIEPANPTRIIFSGARCLRPDRRKKARRNWSRRSVSRRTEFRHPLSSRRSIPEVGRNEDAQREMSAFMSIKKREGESGSYSGKSGHRASPGAAAVIAILAPALLLLAAGFAAAQDAQMRPKAPMPRTAPVDLRHLAEAAKGARDENRDDAAIQLIARR